jgi:hypothetical protein
MIYRTGEPRLLSCTHPALSCNDQLKRRAGIPTDCADDEVYTAFTAAVKEHDARLHVQYAGWCRQIRVCTGCQTPKPSRLRQASIAPGAAAYGEIDRDELNQAYVGSALA